MELSKRERKKEDPLVYHVGQNMSENSIDRKKERLFFFFDPISSIIGMTVFSISETLRRMTGRKTNPERRKILPPDDTGGKKFLYGLN